MFIHENMQAPIVQSPVRTGLFTPKHSDAMRKTTDAINEIVRTPSHPFHNAESRPGKARQRRYERRKIKGYLKMQDWREQEF